MKTIARQSNKKAAFTIVELLTVMSIIVILIGLLVPALSRVKIYAKEVKQNAQFHSMDTAIELFNNDFEGYPDSGALDPMDLDYCGAMKLCEAMMGQDSLGFHTNSVFRRDGFDDVAVVDLYPPTVVDLSARRGPFLPPENANAVWLAEIYAVGVGSFDPCSMVLSDVYARRLPNGKKVGMPILYYRAHTTGSFHDPGRPMTERDNASNIYNYMDNDELVYLGKPWVSGAPTSPEKQHDLINVGRFYRNTESDKIRSTLARPFNADTYILISAGNDGEYGTADDVCNFDWKYRP